MVQTLGLFASIRVAPASGNKSVISASFALNETDTEEYARFSHDMPSSSNLRLPEVRVRLANVIPNSFIMLTADGGENDRDTETFGAFATAEEMLTNTPDIGDGNVPGNVPVELRATIVPEESAKAASTLELDGTTRSGRLKVPREKASVVFAATLVENANSITDTESLVSTFRNEEIKFDVGEMA